MVMDPFDLFRGQFSADHRHQITPLGHGARHRPSAPFASAYDKHMFFLHGTFHFDFKMSSRMCLSSLHNVHPSHNLILHLSPAIWVSRTLLTRSPVHTSAILFKATLPMPS